MLTRAAITCLLAASALFGCVTEKTSPSQRKPADPAAVLPKGPIAAPIQGYTTNSHVLLGLTPVGTVPYDGQVLPLISPDGRFCAVEEGEPPTWPTLVAAPDAQVPTGTHLAVYDLTATPPARLESAQQFEAGLMLGRASDHRGFLVESPRPDGSRWIGRALWQSGQIEWLAREDAVVCHHGVLTTEGDLVFTRRPVTGEVAELVVRTPSGSTCSRSEPDRPYAMPLTTTDPATIYAMSLTPSGIELQALSLKTHGPAGSPTANSVAPKLGPVLARHMLCSDRDAWVAYQIAAPIQGPFPKSAGPQDRVQIEPLAIFSPVAGRMAIFDLRTGGLLPLAPDSISAIRWSNASRPGYLCTTPKGLVFTPEPVAGANSMIPDTRMLFDSYVPRRTNDPKRPALLVGPVKSDPTMLEILGIARPEDDAPAAAPAPGK